MKRIACLFFVLLLAACAPVLAPATAITPALTRTSAPAPTSTIPPTISATTTPSLPADFPPEFQAQIGDADFEIRDGRVWVTDASGEQQDWFEQTPEGKWQTSDWKIFEDAPMKLGWQPEQDWNDNGDIISVLSWPVLTGEPARDMPMTLNDQDMMVTVLPAKIRDMQDPNIFRDVFIPLIYKDRNGNVLLETWAFTQDGGKTVAEFLQSIQRGMQLELSMNIVFKHGRGVCGSERCGFQFDLIAAQELDLGNKIINNGDVLPVMDIQNFYNNGKRYLP